MFKKTLFAAAIFAMSVNNVAAFDTDDVVSTLAGMMDGIYLSDNLDYLKNCMNGADFLVGDV